MKPSEPVDPPPIPRPNSFRLLAGILSAAAGVRGNSKRGSGFADASLGSILGALLIFCSFIAAGGYAFIHAIRSAVAH